MKTLPLLLCCFLASSILIFSACKDDDPTTSNTNIDINYTVGTEAFNYDQVYTINGTAVSFSIAQFYLSSFVFTDADGMEVNIDETTLLITPENARQQMAQLDKGTYSKLVFDLGVAPEDNDQTENDFTTRAESDPLSRQQPSMHWNWNSGYIFFRIDGMVDTDGDGTPETVMEFHTGTNNLLKSLSFPLNADLTANDSEIGINLDMAALFTGIDLKTTFSVHVADDQAAAGIFTENLTAAFSVR